MLASLTNVSKAFADQEVFRDVSAQVNDSDRIGLIGSNGTGKSTLLSVLLGHLEADTGDVFRREDARVGYLKQGSGLNTTRTVLEEMRSVFGRVLDAQKRMEELSRRIERNPEDLSLRRSYDEAESVFTAGDGHSVDLRIRKTLAGMGFSPESESVVVATMSGGEKTRLALARLLLQEPDFLVLDEPTNHLDMATLAWLESYLADYKGAILVVSHDRFFLDRVTRMTWELEDGALETYKGNYTKYRELRRERMERRLKEYQRQQEQIAALEDYVRRNKVRASTSKMAKSRENTLGKITVLKKPRLRQRAPKFRFSAERRSWSDVLTVDDLELQVGEPPHTIARNVQLEVVRGDRAAVLGPNGSGKTTLLRTVLQSLPAGSDHIHWGRNVEVGYYDQENRDLGADSTVLGAVMEKVPGLTEGDARSLLGRVLLTGENVFKRVGDLSGGERAKLGLAILMGKQANVLLLDEPTNHLDLAAREALEEALREFDGTIVFVSHDRYFVNALADKVIALEDGSALQLAASYDAYAEMQKERAASQRSTTRTSGKARSQKELRRIQAERRQGLSDLEKQIAALEAEEADLRRTIEEAPSDYDVLQAACAQLEEVMARSEAVMEQWITLSEEVPEP